MQDHPDLRLGANLVSYGLLSSSEDCQRQSRTRFGILAAVIIIAILLLPVTLIILAVYGLVIGCKKCKKKCKKRQKNRKTNKLLEKEHDAEAAEALGVIV